MDHKRFGFALFLTALWVFVVALIIELGGYAWPATLNELGDFLAGVTAPVAFFWFIVAYLQQSHELRQNNKSLELQAKELEKSVRAQYELVNLTKHEQRQERLREQRKRRMEHTKAQPVLSFRWVSTDRANSILLHRFILVNSGHPAGNVEISSEGSASIEPDHFPRIEGSVDVIIRQTIGRKVPDLSVSYTDGLGARVVRTFTAFEDQRGLRFEDEKELEACNA